jgi:hypothetical protein
VTVLLAFVAAYVAMFAAGFIVGALVNRPRRLPAHPVLRTGTTTSSGSQGWPVRITSQSPARPRLRVIEGGTSCFYDWEMEGG